MSGILIYNKTGERFHDPGEYSEPQYPPNTLFDFTATNPFYLNRDYQYSSQENLNQYWLHPPSSTYPAHQEHLYQRKPLDCASVKILTNNISHLIYQKCRFLAAYKGPGLITYAGSDLAQTVTHGGNTYPLVRSDSLSATFGLLDIGWSRYSSLRLGPFFGIVDRKVEYTNQVTVSTTPPDIIDNSFCLRRNVLVIEGYKQEGSTLALQVVLTSDGGNPRNTNTNIIPIDIMEQAWIEYGTASTTTAPVSPATPITHTIMPYGVFYGIQQVGSVYEIMATTQFNGKFRAFIPLSPTGNIRTINASIQGVGLTQYYVHVGWASDTANVNAISTISLMEVRDPGSQIAGIQDIR